MHWQYNKWLGTDKDDRTKKPDDKEVEYILDGL